MNHRNKSVALTLCLIFLSTTIVLLQKTRQKNIKNNEQTTARQEGIKKDPEKIYVPILVKEDKNVDNDRSVDSVFIHLIPDDEKNNIYDNGTFNFKISKKLLIEEEFIDKGEIYLRFRNSDSAGYFKFTSRTGEIFKKNLKVPPGELGFYDFDKHFLEYKNKVLNKSTGLDNFERITTFNNYKFLEHIYFYPEGGNYEINYITYHDNTEYTLSYNFPALWYSEEYAYAEENRSEIKQQIFDRSLPDTKIKQEIENFETTVRSFTD